jgi:hypothetical protein
VRVRYDNDFVVPCSTENACQEAARSTTSMKRMWQRLKEMTSGTVACRGGRVMLHRVPQRSPVSCAREICMHGLKVVIAESHRQVGEGQALPMVLVRTDDDRSAGSARSRRLKPGVEEATRYRWHKSPPASRVREDRAHGPHGLV